jgi:hypothetical protein
LDVATGHVIAACHERHRAREFRQFLNTINASVPAKLEIHSMLDNYATHKAPTIWTSAAIFGITRPTRPDTSLRYGRRR